MSSVQVLAFGFLNPAMLWGLGLAGVPVLIHLLSRRYVRRVEWGATRFLLIAERKTRRRVRFEQWLLVALRGLALALLALLVARPFVRPGLIAALLGGRGHVARVIVLDDSASESYRIGAAAEFERLKDATGRLLSWLRQEAPHDPVTVCLTSTGGAPLVQDAVLSEADLADLRARIARLEPVEIPAHPGRTLAALAGRKLPASITGADFYVLSDFQQTDWLAGGTDARSVFAPLTALGQAAEQGPGEADSSQPPAKPSGCAVRAVLIASGVQPRNNVALVNAQLERPQTVTGFPAVMKAEVANFAIQTISDVVLQADIDGAPLPATPVGAIEAGQHKTFSLEITFPEEGTHVLTLTLGPVDSFRADDTLRQAVEVKAVLEVLLVNGAPGADEYRDESFLLRNALAPPGPLSSGAHVETVDPEQVRAMDLDRFDAVLLCNVPPPDEAAASALHRYVKAGGGLGIFLGSEVGDPAEYNRALYAGRAGVLPAPLESLVSPPGDGGGVGLLRTQPHAVTAAFPAGSDAFSEYVHFWRYYRCTEPEASGAGRATERPVAVVLARYADQEGTAAIIERDLGRGRVLLFTSTADLEWNDWGRAPDGSYVVTMLELVQYLARRTTEPRFFVAGQPLSVTLSPEVYEPAALFKSPAFPNEPPFVALATAPADPEAPLVVPGPIAMQLGTYVVDLTPRAQSGYIAPAATRPVCVNLDPAESDLAVAGPAALDAALAGIPHELVATADEFLQGAEHTRQELWPALLVLLAVTLMLEQFLAWWFGKPRTGSGLASPRATAGRGRRRLAGLLRHRRIGRFSTV